MTIQICPVCGTRSDSTVRMCPTCGYLLASGPLLSAAEKKKGAHGAEMSQRGMSSIDRVESSKKWTALVLVIVVVVIAAALFVYVKIHADDSYLSATLFYRYSAGNSTSGPSVHVWGDVYNWGESAGSGKLTIVIKDDEGHEFRDSFKVGPVPPYDGVAVDMTYPWDYTYDPLVHPVAPVEVTYSL